MVTVKGLKDKQCFTKHYTERLTNTNTTKTHGQLRCYEMVSSFCSTSGARRVTLVTNPMIRHKGEKDRIVISTNGTYPW